MTGETLKHFLRKDGKGITATADPRWLRVLAALAGGYADLGAMEQIKRDTAIARYLQAEDNVRRESESTLPWHFRELIHSEDAIYALAVHLDTAPAEKKLTANPEFSSRFRPEFLWREPLLAKEIVEVLRADRTPASLIVADSGEAVAAERWIAGLMLGLRPTAAPGDPEAALLERAADDLQDAAFRALHSLMSEKKLPDLPDVELAVFFDAVSSLAGEFDLPLSLAAADKTRGVAFDVYLREMMGRALSGQGDDAVDHFAVSLDQLARAAIKALAKLGASNAFAGSNSEFDVPAPSISSSVEDLPMALFLDILDFAERSPPEISLVRTAVLEELRERPPAWLGMVTSATMELDALAALDWGQQSEGPRDAFEVTDEPSDPVEQLVERALLAPDPGTRARVLLRLLGPLPSVRQRELDAIIIEAIEQISDPFERARTWDMAASRTNDPKVAASRARRARSVSGVAPGERACLLARNCIFLPVAERDAMLVEAVAEAEKILDAWTRAEALRLIRPFALRCPNAAAAFRQLASRLSPILLAYAVRARGEALRLLSDQATYAQAAFFDVQAMAALTAYALAVDELNRSGRASPDFAAVEHAVVTTAEGRERFLKLFEGASPLRLPVPGILVLRELLEDGKSDLVRTILQKLGQYPIGAAPLAVEAAPEGSDLAADLVGAAALGLSKANCAAVVRGLSDADDQVRARATSLLLAPRLNLSRAKLMAGRRSSTVGLEVLLTLTRAILKAPPYVQLRLLWYYQDTVFDGPRLAEQLIEQSREDLDDAEAARTLIGCISACTPSFFLTLIKRAVDLKADPKTVDRVLQCAAKVAYRMDWLFGLLPDDVVIPALRELSVTSEAELFDGGPMGLGRLLSEEHLNTGDHLDLLEMMRSRGLVRTWRQTLATDDPVASLKQLGAEYFSRGEADEIHEDFTSAAEMILRSRGGVKRLADTIGHMNREWTHHDEEGAWRPDDPRMTALSSLMVIAAAIANEWPDTMALALEDAGAFAALPEVAEGFPSYPARRSAFLLMPLGWRRRRAVTSLDELCAIISAALDVPHVREAADRAVGQIREISQRTLSSAYRDVSGSPQRSYVLARALIRICANDGVTAQSLKAAQETLSDIMFGRLGPQLLLHNTVASSSPPRSTLSELIFHQAVFSGV